MNGWTIFAILAIVVGLILAFVAFRNSAKVKTKAKSAWTTLKKSGKGLLGVLITVLLAIGIGILVWQAWGYAEENVWDRFVNTQEWECREENIDDPERVIECVNRADEQERNQSEVDHILANPEDYIATEEPDDPKP